MPRKYSLPPPRNPMAKALSHSLFRARVVQQRKKPSRAHLKKALRARRFDETGAGLLASISSNPKTRWGASLYLMCARFCVP